MREHIRDIRIFSHRTRQKQIGGCASGFKEELEHGTGVERLQGSSGRAAWHAGRRGVDEDDGVFGVEDLPDGIEEGRAEVGAVVVGFHVDAVGRRREDIWPAADSRWVVAVGEGEIYLVNATLHVRKRRRCKIPNPIWMPVLELCRCNVALTCHPSSQGVVARDEVCAWGGDAEVCFIDVE